MKSLILILFTFSMVQPSCSQSQSTKEIKIKKFKSEILKINDSSTFYFDKGIKLLAEGKNPTEIVKSIKPKLKQFEMELDKKAREFQKIAIDLKLTKTEYENVFNELSDSFKANLKKYDYLSENGVSLY